MEYERLTTRREDGKAIYACSLRWEAEDEQTILDRLAELEDKIESGKMIELPCKVGDWVYLVDNDWHWAKIDTIRIYNENNGTQRIVFEWVQYDIGVDVTELWNYDEFDIEEIGKSVLIEGVHDERIKELQAKEEAEYEAFEAESERRLAELTKE